MATDYWPEQDGVIVKGLICGFCYADEALTAGTMVSWGTSAVGRVAVKAAGSETGDAVGVALKSVTTAGDIVPVVFSGIVKLTTAETLAIGNLVINNKSSIAIVGMGASTKLYINSGTQYILGCTMQAGTDDNGDELLVLVGGNGLAFGNAVAV